MPWRAPAYAPTERSAGVFFFRNTSIHDGRPGSSWKGCVRKALQSFCQRRWRVWWPHHRVVSFLFAASQVCFFSTLTGLNVCHCGAGIYRLFHLSFDRKRNVGNVEPLASQCSTNRASTPSINDINTRLHALLVAGSAVLKMKRVEQVMGTFLQSERVYQVAVYRVQLKATTP